MLESLKIISAGAGSGKTYRLTEELVQLLVDGSVRAEGIIATTFTRKAAAELQERVRVRLLQQGLSAQADQLTNALIGTVHGLGVKLLRRFAYEAGVSPQVDIIADEDQQRLFNLSLSSVLAMERVERFEQLVGHLGLNKRRSDYDWRAQVRALIDVARANNFSPDDLDRSKQRSWESFRTYLPEPDPSLGDRLYEELRQQLSTCRVALSEQTSDTTRKTQQVADDIRAIESELQRRKKLHWHTWVKITKLSPGKKSTDLVGPLLECAGRHASLPAFQEDIRDFIFLVFDTSRAAIEEYQRYKKSRGLIDYTDMEVLVNQLLDHSVVQEALRAEIDLLMVDEFQDTSPIQLEIFLKLSQLASQSIWVGDPKQSIYGFRGAEPRLMRAIIDAAGGVQAENIQRHSWRSRQELVYASNAIFTKAFDQVRPEEVALDPMRMPEGNRFFPAEPSALSEQPALRHWHFAPEDGSKRTNRDWFNQSIARALAEWLAGGPVILPKGAQEVRRMQPGDVAILCRSNKECVQMADALHQAGLQATIARSGLLDTAEAVLILACLKFLLNAEDSLSVAEILRLGSGQSLEAIVAERIEFLQGSQTGPWGLQDTRIQQLEALRPRTRELSSAETLDLVLEELDLRRRIVGWGKAEQRLANVDVLRQLALQYEDNCNRIHSAASLGGFLLFLGELGRRGDDLQAATATNDAVQVLTYHKSKGLEWPAVICHSLEQPLRAEVWGVDIIPESDTVDLEHVLANRWLRYWVNPYGDQLSGTALHAALTDSTEQQIKKTQAREEEARLLYVGLTRARDFLVFPTRIGQATGWLNRVYNKGDAGIPTLDEQTDQTPWSWKDCHLDKATQVFLFPKTFPTAPLPPEVVRFLAPRSGRAEPPYLPYHLLPYDPAGGILKSNCGQLDQYAGAADLQIEGDPHQVGRCRKAFLTASALLGDAEDGSELARAHLRRFDLSESAAPQLIRQSAAWGEWLRQYETAAQYHLHYPIRYTENGRVLDAVIDWLLVRDNGLYLFQYSTFSGDKCDRKATELGPFLYYAGRGAGFAFDLPVKGRFVHFVNLGRVASVDVQTEAMQQSLF